MLFRRHLSSFSVTARYGARISRNLAVYGLPKCGAQHSPKERRMMYVDEAVIGARESDTHAFPPSTKGSDRVLVSDRGTCRRGNMK